LPGLNDGGAATAVPPQTKPTDLYWRAVLKLLIILN